MARATTAGLITKTGFMVGLGETDEEIVGCLADLAGVGVDIVTIGQYLRPTSNHLPIARYAEPAEFVRWKDLGEQAGIGHVEASPLTRIGRMSLPQPGSMPETNSEPPPSVIGARTAASR